MSPRRHGMSPSHGARFGTARRRSASKTKVFPPRVGSEDSSVEGIGRLGREIDWPFAMPRIIRE